MTRRLPCTRSPRTRPTRTRPARTQPPRAGFTLVEVVVATVLLAIAALGVASTATAAAHLAATARALDHASRAIAHVVDSLRSTPCRAIAPGSNTSAAGTVTWSVTPHPGTVAIAARLVPASARVRTTLAEELLLSCE